MLSVSNVHNNVWSPEPLEKIGFDVTGDFIFSGVDREPAFEWADGRFTEKQIGWDYPVVQDFVDEDGVAHRQNQIVVRIDNLKAQTVKFGDSVKFNGLGGYYSRKSKRYICHADNIKVLN